MSGREHASRYGRSRDRNAQDGTAHTASPLDVTTAGHSGQAGTALRRLSKVRSREMPTCTGYPKRLECVAVADRATFSPEWSARLRASACG